MPPAPSLPAEYSKLLSPLFEALPLSQAMPQLVVTQPGSTDLVESLVRSPLIAARPALAAGLWLYVDQLDRSHTISQAIENPTGAFWHGIMHRREGDFWNSHYWFRQVGKHPAMKMIDDYEAHQFIDDAEASHAKGQSPAKLLDMQRREWMTLFAWCANA